jgi:uncharacterized protein YaeQ
MNFNDFGKLFDKLYAERLNRYKYNTASPWAKRKTRDNIRALANPDILSDFGILNTCSHESVMAIHDILIEYFKRTYGMSNELSSSWMLHFATGQMSVILASGQMDGVRYFNEDQEIAGPSDNENRSYKNLLNDIKLKDPHINLRIGYSATKDDVHWFIDKYWDDIIAPQIDIGPPANARARKMLRNSRVYSLHKEGMKPKAIQQYIDEEYGDFIELSTISNTIKDFKPPRNWFDGCHKAYEGLDLLKQEHKFLDIYFSKTPKPHFFVEVNKDKVIS